MTQRCLLHGPASKPNNLKRASTDRRPQLVDLGMPVFTDQSPSQAPGTS
ncbi:hypothetical protein ACFVT2_21660 [Streptomyces sp. NPDC058000]